MIDIECNYIFSSAVRTIPAKEIGNRGYLPSHKVKGGIVNYESQIERDFFLLCHHALDVITFQHQPITITYTDLSGEPSKYTPDCFIEFNNGIKILVEIKDENTYQEEKAKFEERWQICKLWAEERGMNFTVFTEIDIRKARLANIWLTLGSSKEIANNKYMPKLESLISKEGIEYNVLCRIVSEEFSITLNKSSQIICFGIYHGYLFVDTFSTKPINKTTIIKKRINKTKMPFKPLWQELDEYLDNREVHNIFKIKRKTVSELKQANLSFFDIELNKKETIVREFLSTNSYQRNFAWRTNFEKKHNLSISAVYKWAKLYEDKGLSGLQNQRTRSGRKSKWDENAFKLLEDARKFYLRPNISIKKAYEHSLTKKWKHDFLDVPSLSSFKRYIKQYTSDYEKEVTRKGSKRKRELEPALKSFQGAIMPMQVLQLDNTPFDLFLQDRLIKKSIGTPNLCTAIDVYTRMITGFELTLNSINRQSILETLVQSILPKERYLDTLFDDNDYSPKWDIQGFPVLILVDNGMDYRSKDIQRFCMEYDIILEFAPIRKPRYKAYIENWFNNLKNGLQHELVNEGYRAKLLSRIENPDFDPELNVIFTYQQSELWLASWILDEYQYTNPYQDGLPAPVLRFEDFKLGKGDLILPEPRGAPTNDYDYNKLQINALMTETRILKDNIEFSNLKYSSPELINLYKRKGKIEIIILYDSRDIRTIWVKNPENSEPIELSLTYGWANTFLENYGSLPISKSFWKKEVELIKDRNRKRITLSIFRKEKGRTFRDKLTVNAKNSKKSKKSRRQDEINEENKMKISRHNLVRGNKYSKINNKANIIIDDDKRFVRSRSKVRSKTIKLSLDDLDPFAGRTRTQKEEK